MTERIPTREEAIRAAATTWRYGCQLADSMSPRELAESAYCVGGPTVEELEAEIREQRGLPRTPEGVSARDLITPATSPSRASHLGGVA